MTDLDASTPPSVRSAGDSWAITELVGATALGVAASRAVETAGAHRLAAGVCGQAHSLTKH